MKQKAASQPIQKKKKNNKSGSLKPSFSNLEKKIKLQAKSQEKKIFSSSSHNPTNELDPYLDFPTKDEEIIYNILDWEYRDIFRNSKINEEKKDLKVLLMFSYFICLIPSQFFLGKYIR